MTLSVAFKEIALILIRSEQRDIEGVFEDLKEAVPAGQVPGLRDVTSVHPVAGSDQIQYDR